LNAIIDSYIACLCKFPQESNDEAVDRLISVYDPDVFTEGSIEHRAVEFMYDYALDNVAMTPRMVQDVIGLTVSQEGLAPESIDIYRHKMSSYQQASIASDAARRLMDVAKGRSQETIDAILNDIDATKSSAQEALSIQEQSVIGLQMYKERIESINSGNRRVAFPWKELNNLVPFIYDDDMILFTGKSKTGKSSAAHQMALSNASRMKVLYFHNEDNELKLFLRRIAQAQLARDPMVSGPDIAHTFDYRQLLSSSIKDPGILDKLYLESQYILKNVGDNIIYVYCAGWTADQIVTTWRKLKRKHNIGMVVIDYLNKIEHSARLKVFGSVPYAMEYTVELIKRECGRKGAMIPCILVQQENEDGTTRDTRSSYIKSQVHISFSRDETINGMASGGRIAVVRANDGMTGGFSARFYAPYMSWT